MHRTRARLLAMGIACLTGCAGDPSPPPEERYRCVEIPNSLVERNPDRRAPGED